MFLEMIAILFLMPVSAILISHIIMQKCWFKSLSIVLKAATIIFLCLCLLVSRIILLPHSELTFHNQILFGALTGLWLGFWIHKSGLNQKNCQTK